MSEENTFAVSAETLTEEVLVPSEPLFEGTVPAVLKSIREFIKKDADQVPTGRKSLGFSFEPTADLVEALPIEGHDPRQYRAGSQRITKWIVVAFEPGANETFKRIEAEALKETARELGLKVNGAVKLSALADTIGRKCFLKMSIKDQGERGFKQVVYVKRAEQS